MARTRAIFFVFLLAMPSSVWFHGDSTNAFVTGPSNEKHLCTQQHDETFKCHIATERPSWVHADPIKVHVQQLLAFVTYPQRSPVTVDMRHIAWARLLNSLDVAKVIDANYAAYLEKSDAFAAVVDDMVATWGEATTRGGRGVPRSTDEVQPNGISACRKAFDGIVQKDPVGWIFCAVYPKFFTGGRLLTTQATMTNES